MLESEIGQAEDSDERLIETQHESDEENEKDYDDDVEQYSEDDSCFGPEEEEDDTVVESVPVNTKKQRKRTATTTGNAKFDKLMKVATTISKAKMNDARIVRMQMKETNEENEIKPRVTKKKKRLRDERVADALHEEIGFDDDIGTMEHRIKKSKKEEFKIDRTVFLSKTRFVPFGTPTFFKDTCEFYSNKTDLCCLWCTEKFTNLPIPFPYKYKQRGRDDFIFHVNGQYCSPSCMLAKMKTVRRSLDMGRLMLKKIYGINISIDIPVAPPIESLKKFGGKYTIKEFRATGGSGIKTAPVQPPFVPFSAGITEIERTQTVISELGGKELACRRISIKTGGVYSNHTPFNNTRPEKQQRGKFASAPSIKDQISLSDQRLRLQRNDIGQTKKKSDIMKFMKFKKKD